MKRENNPSKIKGLAYRVKTLKGEQIQYDSYARGTMLNGVRAKFAQNANVRDFLLNERKDRLAEANPKDFFSIGKGLGHPEKEIESKWEGQNILGQILTQVKHKLKQKVCVSVLCSLSYHKLYLKLYLMMYLLYQISAYNAVDSWAGNILSQEDNRKLKSNVYNVLL